MSTTEQTKAQRLSHVIEVLSSIAYDIDCGNAIDDLDGEDIKRCIEILTSEINEPQTEGEQS